MQSSSVIRADDFGLTRALSCRSGLHEVEHEVQATADMGRVRTGLRGVVLTQTRLHGDRHGESGSAARVLYSVVRSTSRSRAILALGTPAAICALAWASWSAVSVRARPRYLPAALARAIPS